MPFAWLGCNFSFYNFTLLGADISYSGFIKWVRKHSLSILWHSLHSIFLPFRVSFWWSHWAYLPLHFSFVSHMLWNYSFQLTYGSILFLILFRHFCLPAEILGTIFWTEAHPCESHYLRLSGFISIICYFSCFFKKLHCPVSLWEGESF